MARSRYRGRRRMRRSYHGRSLRRRRGGRRRVRGIRIGYRM